MTCLGINTIVGSSIFLFPGQLAGLLGPASFLSFALTGLLLISVGLCFAEAATHFDRAGGSYLYARAAFGEATGFGVGWMCWVTQILGWAAVANGIAVYLGFWGEIWLKPAFVKAVAAAVIVAMGTVNYRGVKLGAWTSNFFTAAKLVPLTVLVLVGLPSMHAARFTPFAPHGWAPMGKACFMAYFAFQGFESVPVPSGEVDRPERTVPFAVVASMLIAAFLYMLVQAVVVGVYPGAVSSRWPLAGAAAELMGPAGAAFIVIGAVCSMVGFNASTALVSPRYLSALAEDSHLPAWLAARHADFDTPHRAVAVTTSVALAAALVFDFNKLVDFSNVVVTVQYLGTCAAVPLLRRGEGAPGSLRLPGGLTIPVLGIAATLWLGMQGGLAELGWSAAVLVLGFVLRAAGRR